MNARAQDGWFDKMIEGSDFRLPSTRQEDGN